MMDSQSSRIDHNGSATSVSAVGECSRPIDPQADKASPLSIGYFCPGWPLEAAPNGIVTYVDAIASGLRTLGHHPHVIARHVAKARVADPTKSVIDLARLSADFGPATRFGDRLIRRLNPLAGQARAMTRGLRRSISVLRSHKGLDLLEMEESFGWTSRLAGRVPIPVVVRLHGPWFLNGPNNGADPNSAAFHRRVAAEGLGLQAADAITAPSRDVLERTRAAYGLALDRAAVIPNPIPPVPPKQRWRPDAADPEQVLFIGRFDCHKGGDTIIDAFARLLRDRPQARLTFVGPDRGLVRDGHRWSLPEYVAQRLPGALEDGRIEWLGQRPQTELHNLRRRAAITVVASRYENFPMTILEALAIGCPLVCTRAGGAAEAFEHGVHGLYCQPEDPEDLATQIATLMSDSAQAMTLGQRAAAYCEQQYHPEVVAARTVAFYRRVLAQFVPDGRHSFSWSRA